jgi:flagellum-specific ATP synthase
MTQIVSPLVNPALIDLLAPRHFGVVTAVDGQKVQIAGLSRLVRLGDRLTISRKNRRPLIVETLGVDRKKIVGYAFETTSGIKAGDRAELTPRVANARPCEGWLGQILNWRGETLDGSATSQGARSIPTNTVAPPAALRRPVGSRLATGMAAFDTFLPICRGQRIGVFAGSGVGKSSLLTELAAGVEADICVIALIGERGREVRSLAEALERAGVFRKAVIVASTSDESALARREGARLALTVAEHFRADGKHVLLVVDSLTRFAEAHREVALANGEPPSLHAYPPSTVTALASLVERAGPGIEEEGDITAVFSVLVSGSDMDEPVADMVRGLLDGHVVLDRSIAERGRYPAINIRRSVSRSLPQAASDEENALLLEARKLIAAYENAELAIQSGLYTAGSDPVIDRAMKIWPRLDAFISSGRMEGLEESFTRLRETLGAA